MHTVKYKVSKVVMLLGLLAFFAGVQSVNAETGVLEIDWSKLDSQSKNQASRSTPFPAVLTQGVKDVTLPVYLPQSHAYDKNMAIVADKNFYTITLTLAEATLIISGDRQYQQTAAGSMADSQLKGVMSAVNGGHFVRAEGMMTTHFNKYGANYSMQLECHQPDQDKRCLQSGFLKKLYNELILVGGHS